MEGSTTRRGTLLTARPLAVSFRVFYPDDRAPLVLCPECFIFTHFPEDMKVRANVLVLVGTCCHRCARRIA